MHLWMIDGFIKDLRCCVVEGIDKNVGTHLGGCKNAVEWGSLSPESGDFREPLPIKLQSVNKMLRATTVQQFDMDAGFDREDSNLMRCLRVIERWGSFFA